MTTKPLLITSKVHIFARFSPALWPMLFAPLAACNAEPPKISAAPPETTAVTNVACGANGHLTTRLFGSIETSILWSGSEMVCESMQRPNNEGVRLRFSGDVGAERFALIIALPELNRDSVQPELATNVTATVEGSGRFFSTPNLDTCWTDIDKQVVVDAHRNEISGRLYCVAPLGEVNGDGTLAISELAFSTTVNWGK